MNNKLTNQIANSLMPLIIKLYFHDDYICPECLRKVPNKTFFTANGCFWCDVKYWSKKLAKQKKI